MTTVGPGAARRAVLDAVAVGILGRYRGTRRRVGVDGVDGAGKTRFAEELASALMAAGAEVVSVSVDGFHHLRPHRYRQGRESPIGFFEDSYDYGRLEQLLLAPFGAGGDGRFVRAIYDVVRDQPIEPVFEQAGPSAILIVDGIFLHRPELRVYWDYSVFLDVDFAVSVGRMGRRDGTSPDPAAEENRRYVDGQKIYLSRCEPMRHASIVIDYNDLEHPRIS